MNQTELLDLINRNPVFFLATTENGEPRVRGMLLYRADEQGIVFHTGTMKDVCRQLLEDPVVEMCFNDWQQNVQVRVRGRALQIKDPQLVEEIINSPGREFLKPWVERMGTDILAVFRVSDGQAQTWSMESNFAPKEFIPLSLP